MGRTTNMGVMRSHGDGSKASVAGTPVLMARASFLGDAAVGSVNLFKLPAGATIIEALSLGDGTGTTPTVNVGTVADSDGIAINLASDSYGGQITGALVGTTLAVQTQIVGGTGTGTPDSVLTTVLVSYVMNDDGLTS